MIEVKRVKLTGLCTLFSRNRMYSLVSVCSFISVLGGMGVSTQDSAKIRVKYGKNGLG